MSVLVEDFILENGIKIPKIGFGTWQVPNGEVAYNAVSSALKAGYRHIDTAYAYQNEPSVGSAIRDSGIDRSEIFVTSKLPAEIKTYDGAWDHFNQTMENIGLDYIDLYLIHAPWPWSEIGKDCTEGNIQVWKAMEEIYQSGRCRSIGVSNFNVKDLTAIIENGNIKPMVNQIRYFIGFTQNDVVEFCEQHHILVEGYSPLATGAILSNGKINELAKKYHRTLPQICIRYVLQKGVLPLPKSVHPEYIQQNADIDFEIEEEDMNYLDQLKDTVTR